MMQYLEGICIATAADSRNPTKLQPLWLKFVGAMHLHDLLPVGFSSIPQAIHK